MIQSPSSAFEKGSVPLTESVPIKASVPLTESDFKNTYINSSHSLLFKTPQGIILSVFFPYASEGRTVVEYGIVSNHLSETPTGSVEHQDKGYSRKRKYRVYSDFFNCFVKVYTAKSDPLERFLFRARDLAKRCGVSLFTILSWLENRINKDGIYIANESGRDNYFITLEVCKEFEYHKFMM